MRQLIALPHGICERHIARFEIELSFGRRAEDGGTPVVELALEEN